MKEILFKIKRINQLIIREIMNSKKRPKNAPNPTQMKIIDYILQNKNKDILQKDLEGKLGVSRATVSDVLATMEKYGFIKRVQSEVDTRTNKIIIQEKALEFFEKENENIRQLNNKLIQNISDDELEIFNNVIEKMINNLQD